MKFARKSLTIRWGDQCFDFWCYEAYAHCGNSFSLAITGCRCTRCVYLTGTSDRGALLVRGGRKRSEQREALFLDIWAKFSKLLLTTSHVSEAKRLNAMFASVERYFFRNLTSIYQICNF